MAMPDLQFIELPKNVWGLVSAWRQPYNGTITIRLRLARKPHFWRSNVDYIDRLKFNVVPSGFFESKLLSVWVKMDAFRIGSERRYYYVDVKLRADSPEQDAVHIAKRWVCIRTRMLEYVQQGETTAHYERGAGIYTSSPLEKLEAAAADVDGSAD